MVLDQCCCCFPDSYSKVIMNTFNLTASTHCGGVWSTLIEYLSQNPLVSGLSKTRHDAVFFVSISPPPPPPSKLLVYALQYF